MTAAPARPLGAVQPADERWGDARRLLREDSLPVADRVAGLLVLLYGQTLSRISRLRRDDVDVRVGPQGRRVARLRLGRDAVELREPLSTLVQGLRVAVSTGTARDIAGLGTWLLPGRQPGRAAHSSTLAIRLRRLGIQPRAARNSALLHLAEHLPAAVLADLLGLHINTAERWNTNAGSRWMS